MLICSSFAIVIAQCNFDIFQHDRLVTKLQHRREARGNTPRIMKTNAPLQILQGKPCAFDKSGILGVFFFWSIAVIFACIIIKYCAFALCRNGNKKRLNLSYFCFPTRPNERKKWEVFCKRAHKKFKILGDPRICSLHFKESNIEISKKCTFRLLFDYL